MNSSSVMTNRRMNETVGGMRMMAQGANMLTEYTVRVFVETWVEPTLRQLVKLEQYYESDETVLAIAAQKAGLYEKFGRNADLDRLLQQELTLSVNVGMGATDPEARMQKFMQAMGAYNSMVQASAQMPDMNIGEVRKELFGLAGFRDSKRFFNPQPNPQMVQAQQMMQQAQSIAMQLIDQHKDRIQRRERALDEKEHTINDQMSALQQEMQIEVKKAQQEFVLAVAKQNQEMQQAEREAAMRQRIEIDEHVHEKQMAELKVREEAALEVFKARMDMMIEKMRAAQEMALAEQKAKAEIKNIRAKKAADGSWEITRH